MTYSAKDLERARVFLNRYSPDDFDVAQLIADVRREALEEAASHVENGVLIRGHSKDFARRIRALKDRG